MRLACKQPWLQNARFAVKHRLMNFYYIESEEPETHLKQPQLQHEQPPSVGRKEAKKQTKENYV